MPQPSFTLKDVPGKSDMFFLKHPLAGVPTIGFADRLVDGYRVFVVCDPMNRGEKFHSKRCFKTGYEIDNPLKMVAGRRMIF